MNTPHGGGPQSDAEDDLESISHELLQGISSHAIFKLDSEGYIEYWPASAATLYGYEPDEVVGEHLSTLFADEVGQSPALDELLAEANAETQESEHWHEQADGSGFWATLTVSPLRDANLHGYAVVSRDTTRRKEYEQMLERQNDRLKEFTDILAHDLRNPLRVIEGNIELYRDTPDDELIDNIEETTERMERLVDDLLRIARQGTVVTDPEPTDLGPIIEIAWEGTGDTTGQASLEYETVPTVNADSDRLCELFENLFRNAIEHAGPEVEVRVGPIENGFYVEDDGHGIPADLIDDVFDHGVTTADDGSGYGLSVVRTIANAHGWDVHAVAAETGGARFEITGIEFLN